VKKAAGSGAQRNNERWASSSAIGNVSAAKMKVSADGQAETAKAKWQHGVSSVAYRQRRHRRRHRGGGESGGIWRNISSINISGKSGGRASGRDGREVVLVTSEDVGRVASAKGNERAQASDGRRRKSASLSTYVSLARATARTSAEHKNGATCAGSSRIAGIAGSPRCKRFCLEICAAIGAIAFSGRRQHIHLPSIPSSVCGMRQMCIFEYGSSVASWNMVRV
jgi:hypothetical protein